MLAAVSWGTDHLPVLRRNVEERIARAYRIWPQIKPRMKKEMAVGYGWIDVARACNPKNIHDCLALHQASRRDSAHRLV